jgi:hypothetical protein
VTTVRRQNLQAGDFPVDQRELLLPILRAINELASDAADILNSGITITNTNGFLQPVSEITTLPVRFQWGTKMSSTPVGVLIVDAQDLTEKGQPKVSLGSPAWGLSGDQLHVTAISGLTAGHKYRITFLVLGGE